ncbi:MAG: hypothetical protein JNK48_23775 [Bryobacterales bacterium]|nr:hypothetical protein [Bryobacterales bacterium]
MIFVFLLAMTAFAQDPYKVAAKNYKLEFENDWVRVSRVRYEPGDKTAVHDHPSLPTVYVYLTDGGEIQFGHQEFYALRRRPVKAGQIRFNRGNRETHTTEYFGDKASEYLRVEFKTEADRPAKDVQIAPEDQTPFENKMLRIERCGPCKAVAAPSVLVSLKERSAQWLDANAAMFTEGEQVRVEVRSRPLREGLP